MDFDPLFLLAKHRVIAGRHLPRPSAFFIIWYSVMTEYAIIIVLRTDSAKIQR